MGLDTLTSLELIERLALAEELLKACFNQACGERNDKNPYQYDHMCLSAYESTQDYLIEHGLIKKDECSRK